MKRNTANSLVTWRARLAALFIALALADCGGGSSPYCSPMCQLDKQIYVNIAGSLSGLVGSGLELQDSSVWGTYSIGQPFKIPLPRPLK
jgi:hypothetical protein